MSATLHVQLFGDFKLAYKGQLVTRINTPRLQSFLAYLLLHCRTPQPRQHVAFTFWPDAGEAQARNNLRQFLHQLRQALPDADQFIHTDASALHWRAGADNGGACALDVTDFERAMAEAAAAGKRGDVTGRREALASAVALYSGDLLPSCYDEWVAPERERLRATFADALRQLAGLLEGSRDAASAIPHAQRLCELDPLDEDAHAALMRLHALSGNRASALRAYQSYAAALKGELGIEPGRDIRDTYERLLRTDAQAQESTPRHAVIDVVSPLIGRQPEWERLLVSWHAAERGQPGMTLISGEAGIGKTRLAEELLLWAGRQGISLARTRAYATEGRLAYAPVTEWLRSDAIQDGVDKLDTVWLTEAARILPELLIERPDLPQPSALNDPSQRGRFFEALARAVLATHQPLLLVIDDVQWCDQETLEWLRYLLRFDASPQLLIVATARTEEVDPKHPLTRLTFDLRNVSQLTEIELKRLDAAESAHLASHVLSRPVELSEATQLYRDSEGNPLFIVEMARAGLSGGAEERGGKGDDSSAPPPPSTSAQLPPRVQAVIASRLAQLSEPATELMNLGATIGRAFSFDVLAQASDADEDSLLRSLDELWQRRIVRAQDANSYDFTHDKLREVAYAQLSPAKRKLLHRRAARAIEAVHAADLDPVSAQLAAHYEQAGAIEPAVAYYLRAAKVARRLFASDQSISLVDRGLSLLPQLVDSTYRLEQEFELLTQLGTVFGVIGSEYGTTTKYDMRVQFDMLVRAQKLGQQLGKPPHPFILRALSTSYIVVANYEQSLLVGKQLLELAEQERNPILMVEAHEALGITHFWTGAFAQSRTHLEQSLALYDPEQLKSHIELFAWDPKVIGRCRLALGLWCLGYPDQAVQMQQQSLALAETLGHPFTSGYAVFWDVLLQHMLGNVALVLKQTEAIITLSQKHYLVFWLRNASTFHGWAVAASGELERGIDETQRGMEDFYALGITNLSPFYFTLLAELYAKLGQFDRSLKLLADAAELTDGSNERWHEAELHRVRGNVLFARGADMQEVEAAYCRAMEIAQTQQAKSYELRAAMSLARLWQSQRKVTEARNLMQPIYDWFTEGFDTRDLKEARALLDELST